MRLTIDSFAWIEVIRGTRLGIASNQLMRGAELCFTPAIVLAEVAHRCIRDGLGEDRTRRELSGIMESSELVPVTPDLALAGASATMELRKRAASRGQGAPGLGDGLALATARRTRSAILTGDLHFLGLAETHWLG